MFKKMRERMPYAPSPMMHVPPQQMMGVPPSMHQIGGGAPNLPQERFTRIGMSPDQQQMMGIPPEHYHVNGNQHMTMGVAPYPTVPQDRAVSVQHTKQQMPPHPYPIHTSEYRPRGKRGVLSRNEEAHVHNPYAMMPSSQPYHIQKQEQTINPYPPITPNPPSFMQNQDNQQNVPHTPYPIPPYQGQSNQSMLSQQQGAHSHQTIASADPYAMMPSNQPYPIQPQANQQVYNQYEAQSSNYQQQMNYTQEHPGMIQNQQHSGHNPFHLYMPQEQSVPFFPPNEQNFQTLGGMGPQSPYPVQQKQNGKKEPSQFQNILAQFKSSDGNYDINKMMNTAGTMMNTMNQLSGMVKQVGAFFSVK